MTPRGTSRASEPTQPTRRVRWTSRARSELAEIVDYISEDDPAAALRWRKKLLDAADAAAIYPLAGRVVPEMRRPDIREVIKRTYRIIYAVRADRIDVLSVFEGHRRLTDLDPDPDA